MNAPSKKPSSTKGNLFDWNSTLNQGGPINFGYTLRQTPARAGWAHRYWVTPSTERSPAHLDSVYTRKVWDSGGPMRTNGWPSNPWRLFKNHQTFWRIEPGVHAMTDGPRWTLGSPARSGPRRLCGGALFFDQSVGRPKIGGSNRLGGTRTLNAQFEPRILSPLRLPIPPRAQNLTLPISR